MRTALVHRFGCGLADLLILTPGFSAPAGGRDTCGRGNTIMLERLQLLAPSPLVGTALQQPQPPGHGPTGSAALA
jgi:hypothetical protein